MQGCRVGLGRGSRERGAARTAAGIWGHKGSSLHQEATRGFTAGGKEAADSETGPEDG